jgi:hypothetical protein
VNPVSKQKTTTKKSFIGDSNVVRCGVKAPMVKKKKKKKAPMVRSCVFPLEERNFLSIQI